MTDIDVLIVGLGPAGAAAGAAAARSGCSVVALERNANRGLPVQCAEFVPLMINAGEDVASIGHATVQNIDRMETFVEASDADITLDFRGQMIDRAEFDRFLIARAEASGVQCCFSSPVRDITEDGLVQTADGRQFKGKVIIGADGPRSPVATAIGASNEDLVETRQITVPLHKAHDATDIFLSADIPGGYGWLFPKGDVANLGLGLIPSEKHQLKPLLEQLHARLVEEGRVGEQVLSHTGGLIPVGGIRQAAGKIADTAIILAGDAAGLTNPVTGAGINSAVISGRMAGEAAAEYVRGDDLAIEDYAEEIHDLFGPSIDRAVARRQQVLAAYANDQKPGPENLRSGWIAYPQYWSLDDLERPASAATHMRKSA